MRFSWFALTSLNAAVKAGRNLPPLPNFLILGASRAGTSTLHAWLGQHPDIFMSRPKELWHFNRDDRYRRGLHHYRAKFKGWQGEQVSGECTPIYLYRNLLYRDCRHLYWSGDDGPVRRIARDLPQARLLVSLRHPLDRFISQHRKNSLRGKAGVDPDLDSFARHSGASGMGYRADIENLLRLVARERLHFVVFEEWTQAPDVMLRDVCRFLGVSPDFRFDVSSKVVRTGAEGMLLSRLVTRLQGRYRDAADTRLSPGLRDEICAELADDIAFVETLLGRPIDSWRAISGHSGQ